MEIISKIFNYDTHRDSDKPNSISVSTLLGSKYKAKKYLNKEPKDYKTDLVLNRSSFIGTACHERMEKALEADEVKYINEVFAEREIDVDGVTYTIAGTFDLLIPMGEGYEIADMKTGYFKTYPEDKLKTAGLQMSLYRWLNQHRYTIGDRAWVIAVSQSHNYIDEIPVELMSLEATQSFIEDNIFAIAENTKCDCFDGIKYSPCNYCNYSNCGERK